ncbi:MULTISPECIES: hypothetical protein [unclassified Ensifer]|uniref:hypothetical protein n=1 Tax=unclassified Ensifer TaxID=2633371 RepID=UPI001379478C|nr:MULTISPECIES: hypothetical protein [unclassified Ensifer]
MYQLSDISPELYLTGIGDVLQRIDRVGVPLVAAEPGNEITWAPTMATSTSCPR